MKKVLLFLVFLILSSCSLRLDIFDQYEWTPPFDITTMEEAKAKAFMITYASESGERWQFPEETFLRGTGDCDDSSIYFAYLIEYFLRMDTRLVVLRNLDTGKYHMVVYSEGDYYEAVGYPYKLYSLDGYKIIIWYTLETALTICEFL